MAGNYGHYSPQEFDPFAPDTQRFQDAETEIPGAVGDRHDPPLFPIQQQPYRTLGNPVASRSNNPFLRNISPQSSYSSVGSPSPVSPWPPAPASRQAAPLGRQKSLGDYFAIEEVPRTIYTDQEFADIARLLKETDRESWSRVPRIYTVLRLIGQVPAIDGFLDLGLNDLWLPFHVSQLPKSMPTFYREKFIESQAMVLTKAVDLENASLKKHTHFRQGEPFPFDVGDKLGEGGYASVDKVYSPLSGRTYARKRFRRTKAKQSDVQSFMTELQVLKRINHQHCVELVASYTDSKYFGLLISPVADYNLSAFYNVVAGNEENKKILRSFFGCLAHALQFLHHNKIRHRDIKPENILVKGTAVYFADFGISLDWENLSRSTTTEDSGKSWTYCAPEVAHYEKRNSSSDIWSLGCVYLEMLTVLKGFTVHDLRDLFRKHSGRPRFYENFDAAMGWAEMLNGYGIASDNEVARWVREMVVIDPSSRTTAETLSVSIVTYGMKSKTRKSANPFCGECCSHDHDIESSSEVASDDDVWANADITTPVTSAPVTDDSQRLGDSKMGGSVDQSLLARSGAREPLESDVAPNLGGLQLSDSHANESTNYDRLKEEELLREEEKLREIEVNVQREIYEKRQELLARESQLKEIEARMLREQEAADANDKTYLLGEEEAVIAAKAQDSHPVVAAEENSSIAPLTARRLTEQSQNPASAALVKRPTIDRRHVLEEVTTTFQAWPFSDFQGRLPTLTAASWQKPSDFLESIKSDVLFMEYLRSSDASQFGRFKDAGLDDMVPLIHLLLLNGLDINNPNLKDTSKDAKGSMPLMWTLHPAWGPVAARNEVVKLLIGFGANLDARLDDGRSPVTRTSGEGNTEMLRIFLDLGCRPDEISEGGANPIFYAAANNQTEALTMLLDHGAAMRTVNFENESKATPLAAAAAQGHLEAVKFLLAKGAFHRLGLFSSPLFNAAQNGKEEVVRYLLDNGYYDDDVNHRHKGVWRGWTPLHIAANRGHHNIVSMLLKHGANAGLMNPNSYTALHLACEKGHALVVKELIAHGASFRTSAPQNDTPALAASQMGHLEVMKVLIQAGLGADEGTPFITGDWRPIHVAASAGQTEMVKFLIEKGADPTRRIVGGFFGNGMISGATPLNLAKKGQHKETITVIEQAIKERKRRRRG